MKLTDDDIIEQVGLMHFYGNIVPSKHIISNILQMTFKEHLKSFIITFVVAFAIVLVANINEITIATFESGAIYAILFGAIRAGVKGVLELLITTFSKQVKPT